MGMLTDPIVVSGGLSREGGSRTGGQRTQAGGGRNQGRAAGGAEHVLSARARAREVRGRAGPENRDTRTY